MDAQIEYFVALEAPAEAQESQKISIESQGYAKTGGRGEVLGGSSYSTQNVMGHGCILSMKNILGCL